MTTKMKPHIFVHQKLGFGRPANDPQVQSIVDEMHATNDAAKQALKELNAIKDNIPETVLFDQQGRGLNPGSALAATFETFSDDKKVAKVVTRSQCTTSRARPA